MSSLTAQPPPKYPKYCDGRLVTTAMLIEFVGCSGAGKTTQIERVLAALLARKRAAASSTALIAERTHTAWIKDLTLRNVCLDFFLFPWLLLAFKDHFGFCLFGLLQIVRNADSGLSILQRVLSQLRNVAGNELLRRLAKPEFILIDEGTICGVHNVLVHLKRPPEDALIETYSRLVPKPELIIHIDTPVDVAFSRTEARLDPPLRFHTLSERLRFVQLGHATHAALGKCEAFRSSWYTIHPSNVSSPLGDRTLEDIVNVILSKEAENNGRKFRREG